MKENLMPGFGPATEVLFFREKDPKPLTPRSASRIGRTKGMRARQLATLKQGPPVDQSVRPWSQTAGVGQERAEFLGSGLAITQSAFGFTQLSQRVTIHCHIARPAPQAHNRLAKKRSGIASPS